MSDEEFEFDYSDEEQDNGDDTITLENTYFISKEQLSSDVPSALRGFAEVVALEKSQGNQGEWGFRALKKMVKQYFKMGDEANAVARYKDMLDYAAASYVTRAKFEKSITSLLDFISQSPGNHLVQTLYEQTLSALAGNTSNERLWFKTQLKLGRLFFDAEDYSRLARVIADLKKSCVLSDGSEDTKKGPQWMEIYSLEIQYATQVKNSKKLKELYNKCLNIKMAIPGPMLMGTIRECGGKMFMREREWAKAEHDFFEAFKNYDDCGSPRRIVCLKYLVLSNMLNQSHINPFDSQEAKPYVNHPEIVVMNNLVQAYQNSDITAFERIINRDMNKSNADAFMNEYLMDLLKNIRIKKLVKILLPYSKINIAFISQLININDVKKTEKLVISMILDKHIDGALDQITGTLVLNKGTARVSKVESLNSWAKSINTAIINSAKKVK